MAKNTVPEVGMGATKYLGSDRYPFTIIKVLSPTTIVVQEDDANLIEGNYYNTEHQVHEYTRNTESREVTLTKRKNGRWVERGDSMKGTPYSIGERDRHNDPSF